MSRFSFEHAFEIDTLKRLIAQHQAHFRHRSLLDFYYRGEALSVTAIELGAQESDAPCVLFVGGVHGVERIGAQVVLAFLGSLLNRLDWDTHLQALLRKVRLAFVPIVNPAGFLRGSRGNGQDVDLMRNAPIEAQEGVTFLVGGQRFSRHLPWYRGEAMAAETKALIDYVTSLQARSSSLLALDAHSGFGLRDHLWFPHAHTREPFAGIGYVYQLHKLFEKGYPHHGHYQLAPQSHFYRTHGDIWDYLVTQVDGKTPFVPLTLEMGSWAWVRKNPRQLFNFPGYFNPQAPHRHHRILRRHVVLMQFLLDAAYGRVLERLSPSELSMLTAEGQRFWFNRGKR
ncbi:M14 family zinc carboxypeptidase [Shewanella sp. KCT]|uniref:M14 family zinc carboxypeptidase n=1 Tax=Shewanella sp. KCT TaxID=2569535 RepID=UPI0011824BF9|nr:M14 family zinc carboxypeptidase [Shewanella sp. KCT]TVP14255.1 zinc carboxypeptidase [Shewanella sp. KCT]